MVLQILFIPTQLEALILTAKYQMLSKVKYTYVLDVTVDKMY